MGPILVVCTGNVCRSPLAEGFLRAALASRFGAGAPTVTSAGTSGWEGSRAMPESVEAAAERGVDISGHVGRRLMAGHVRDADLVLAMAAEHRDEAADAVPQAAGKTFTLKELVRLLETLPAAPGRGEPEERLVRRVAEADTLRASGFEGNPSDEDIVDPLGLPLEGFRAVAWELDEWCGRLVDGVYGKAAARVGTGTEGE